MEMGRIVAANQETIAQAALLLKAGSLIAFPTETVYGLGGDARDDQSVAEIFAAKGRPSFNPLIIHVAGLEAAAALAEFDERARQVAARFWPGPLTLVLNRKQGCPVSLLASAGLPSIAIRVPTHPVALALLRAFGGPIAAPSANASGRLSPTEAHHVAQSLGGSGAFGGSVAMILDGGRTPVGIESTVLDLTGPKPVVLRPGGVSKDILVSALGSMGEPDSDGALRSPGMLLAHYAPSRPLRMDAEDILPGEALLGFGPTEGATLNLSEAGDLVEAASNLFAMLHRLDARPGFKAIAVAPIPGDGLGAAINDRLRRAARRF